MPSYFYRYFIVAFLIAAPAQGAITEEFRGTRSQAMGGAHRALGTSNDTLTLNPAGMAIGHRYSAALQYAYSPIDGLSRYNATIVDSKSGPVAGGISYTFDSKGNNALHRINIGSAYAITEGIALGVSSRYLRGDYSTATKSQKNVSALGGDLGLLAYFSQNFSLGFTYHNIFNTGHAAYLLPRSLGFAAAVSTRMFVVTSDLVLDIHIKGKRTLNYHAGSELFLANKFPLRIGYQYAPFTPTNQLEHSLTGGVGWVDTNGSIDFTYQQSVIKGEHWSLLAALTFFM